MDKNEILEQSRKQNKSRDPFEQEVIAQGSALAYSVGLLICTMFFMLETLINHHQNYALMAIWISMEATLSIYKYCKLRKTSELVFAVIFTVCSLCFIVLHILYLAGIME